MNIILSLQNPTDKAADAVESLGVQVYDSQGNMRSMNDILGDLNTSIDLLSVYLGGDRNTGTLLGQ